MAKTPTRHQLIERTDNNLAAGGSNRATLDCSAAYGGIVTMKIKNDNPAPVTTQATCNIHISHETTAPAPGSAGDNAGWKTVFSFGGGLTASAITEQHFVFGPEVRFLQVEFLGGGTNAVDVEAYATTYVFT